MEARPATPLQAPAKRHNSIPNSIVKKALIAKLRGCFFVMLSTSGML
uniref:Uncharacterized protein n=1 Tax=Siphoviridae sp. ct1SN28 TaxID=2825308 RepID=A0A8S5TRK0_9CAUD|nr:MAG TPA: hypothetical protein [Siphoviridae sp. ct1SN28]